MAPGGRTPSKHEVQGRTLRTQARWRAAPWVAIPASMVAIAWLIAGKTTELAVDVTLLIGLSLSFSVVGLGAIAKIVVDGREKKRLRAERDDLQRDWETADENLRKAREDNAALRAELRVVRGGGMSTD